MRFLPTLEARGYGSAVSLVVCFKKWRQLVAFAAFFSQIALVGPVHAGERSPDTHTVQSGDVLSIIAEREAVSLAHLLKVNRLGNADQIRPGQVLLLPRIHRVQPGEVLGVIAERHGVSLSTLYQHNDLNENSVLRVGQRLIVVGGRSGEPPRSKNAASETSGNDAAASQTPKESAARQESKAEPQAEYHQHRVRPGEVLGAIAARFAVPTMQLCELNHLSDSSLIRAGQRLKIPVNERNLPLTRPEPPKPWHKYARKNFKRGYLTLTSLGRKWSGQALDKQGNILPEARKRMHWMLAAWRTGKRIALAPRLLQLIVQVSDEFGGRAIRVVSGYREQSYSRHSRHRVGRALDFSIPGVPNSAIVDFLLTLPDTGVGYYPNSTHVHMDARSYRMYWVDTSGPGQAPRYVHKSTTGERAPARKAHAAVRRPVRDVAQSTKRRLPSSKSVPEQVASLSFAAPVNRP